MEYDLRKLQRTCMLFVLLMGVMLLGNKWFEKKFKQIEPANEKPIVSTYQAKAQLPAERSVPKLPVIDPDNDPLQPYWLTDEYQEKQKISQKKKKKKVLTDKPTYEIIKNDSPYLVQ